MGKNLSEKQIAIFGTFFTGVFSGISLIWLINIIENILTGGGLLTCLFLLMYSCLLVPNYFMIARFYHD